MGKKTNKVIANRLKANSVVGVNIYYCLKSAANVHIVTVTVTVTVTDSHGSISKLISSPPSRGTVSPSSLRQYAPPPTHKTHLRSSHTEPSNTRLIVGLAVAGFVFITLVTVCVTCCCWRKKKRQKAATYYTKPPPGGVDCKNKWPESPREHVIQFTRPEMIGVPVGVGGRWTASQQFSTSGQPLAITPERQPQAFNMNHNELSKATDGFSSSNLLGPGGSGYVHKNRREVAVKRLKSGSNQGERKFQAQVEIISRVHVHHRHLVSLAGAQRILVYEYVPNKTLDFHLHGMDCPAMKWETRIRIALGSAKGLAYLHQDCDPRIIHRDIKSSNILLDDNFETKVADFGLAKPASREDTHISTCIMDTFGYFTSEYASSGKITEKSYVFSFGVMLLELFTRRKPIDPTSYYSEESLVDWAGPLLAKALEDRYYDGTADPRLDGNYEPSQVARMVSCTAASIHHSAKRRRKMSQIVRVLESNKLIEDNLDEALKPQRMECTLSVSQSPDTPTSIVNYTMAYNNDMKSFMEKLGKVW
ncbi:proline-rich receptor-like protein kinase PERK15 [Bidens hawaiensis]|uniref:proline-rich receptor-like protein kinase PERK15 n=1 Tax=Bidens hawaiensis TaxID=980011 RepID=UPI00404B8236